MKILILAQYFPPDLGGAATRAYNIAKGLTLNGCEVTVIAAFPHYPHGKISKEYRWKPLKTEWIGKVKVIRTFMPPIKTEGFFKRLLLIGCFTVSSLFALPSVGKFDAVWASSWIPGYFYSKLNRKALALNVDDLTLEDLVDLRKLKKGSIVLGIGEKIYRLFFVKGAILTPISFGYFDIIEKKYCVEHNRIHLVRGGVDLSVFRHSTIKDKSGKFVVLYSGAFSIAYDFDQIFRAAKILEKVDPDIEFVIQGSGELLESMYNSIYKLKIKNVRIINKIITRQKVAELLAQADVLILPLVPFYKSGTPYRGMSSKLYEYQAVGKPIISCSKGIPSEYVMETNSGIAINPDDHEALAKAVLELKQNPKIAELMGENGRKYVENEVSIEAIGLKIKEILQISRTRKQKLANYS
ncbi:MAG TPA: glycosyltransferase family 4 protein [Candidatus Acidoferrum sp.]|nr:glycosyltransferase family 4 protein [Candidatus Acidoferrum sp.]